jgi:hypothetical protein
MNIEGTDRTTPMCTINELAVSRRLAIELTSIAETVQKFRDLATYCWASALLGDDAPRGLLRLKHEIEIICNRINQLSNNGVTTSTRELITTIELARDALESHWMNNEHMARIRWRRGAEDVEEYLDVSLRSLMVTQPNIEPDVVISSCGTWTEASPPPEGPSTRPPQPEGCPFYDDVWTALEQVMDRLGSALPTSQNECLGLARSLTRISWQDGLPLVVGSSQCPNEQQFSDWFSSEAVPSIRQMLRNVSFHFPELTLCVECFDQEVTAIRVFDAEAARLWTDNLLTQIRNAFRQADAEQNERPHWSPSRGLLRLGRREVRISARASNLRPILETFQQHDFPTCVEIQLPRPRSGTRQTPGQRLTQARKDLNKIMRRHSFPISFGAGTGPNQVCWERIPVVPQRPVG